MSDVFFDPRLAELPDESGRLRLVDSKADRSFRSVITFELFLECIHDRRAPFFASPKLPSVRRYLKGGIPQLMHSSDCGAADPIIRRSSSSALQNSFGSVTRYPSISIGAFAAAALLSFIRTGWKACSTRTTGFQARRKQPTIYQHSFTETRNSIAVLLSNIADTKLGFGV